MTQDEILEMARQVGMRYREIEDEFHSGYSDGVYLDELEAFAKLVEDKTRRDLREEIVYTWVPPYFVDLAIESCAERAWLALVKHKQPWNVRQDVTEAIRATAQADRGEA
jgi:hypothetical protein